MALGDSRFPLAGNDINTIIDMHGILLSFIRNESDKTVSTDIFGTPQNYTPPTYQYKVVVTGQELKENLTEGGGKPFEVVYFMTLPDTVKENDEMPYNSHVYIVFQTEPSQMGGIDTVLMCRARREVDL